MAIENIAIKAGEILKSGIEKSTELLKSGESLRSALKEGFSEIKMQGFESLQDFLSPVSMNKLEEASTGLDNIDEKIGFSSSEIDNVSVVDEVNTIETDLVDILNELNEVIDEMGMLSDIQEGIADFKELLEQLKEVKSDLADLGIKLPSLDSHLLSFLSGNGEIGEEEEIAEGE